MDHLQPCSSLLPAWTGKYLWGDMEENIRNKAKCLLNFWKHQLHDATLSNLLKSSRNRILFAKYHFKNEIGGLTKGCEGSPRVLAYRTLRASIGSSAKRKQFGVFCCSDFIKMPHGQQVLTWDLDRQGRCFKNTYPWTALQRIQGQCWLCAEHNHSPAPAGGSSAPHYKGCTMRIQNGFEGFILTQRAPQESQNTRTFGLERF